MSDVCGDNIDKDTKHTRQISRRIHFVRNGEEWNLHKTVCFKGGLKLADIGTENVIEDELNNILRYNMVRPDNWHNNCTRGVIWYRIFCRAIWPEWLDWIQLRIRLNKFEIFIWVRMMKRTLKTVLRIRLKTCRKVSRNWCIIENLRAISHSLVIQLLLLKEQWSFYHL